MGSKRRDQAAGIFHVYTHCVWASRELFRDDHDRLAFLHRLARVNDAVGWTCLAYCLMGSHYHLLLDVEDNVMPVGMHRLNLGYARDFNRRHGLRGHLQFQPYGSDRIRTDEKLVDRFAYVALNPVEAGSTRQPEDWPWSSYAETAGFRAPGTLVDASRVLSFFEDEPSPELALRRHVASQLGRAA